MSQLKSFSKPLKVISCALALSFLGEQLLWANPEIKPFSLPKDQPVKLAFRFPESVASIEDSYRAPERRGTDHQKTIYLFQDAHTNESGQRNLAKALDIVLAHNKDIKYVFTEAGVEDNSLTFLRDKASLDIRKQASNVFLKKGLLHGTELLQLTSDHDFILWGVEDMSLYQKALESYRDVAHTRGELHVYLAKIRTTLDTLNQHTLNPVLSRFLTDYRNYHREKTAITDYFDALSRLAGTQNINVSQYPGLSLLGKLKQKESDIDFAKANAEQMEALKRLSEEDKEQLQEILKTEPGRVGSNGHAQKAFYSFLKEKGAAGAELNKYFEYLDLSKDLEAKKILDELSALESALFASLGQTQDETTFIRCAKLLNLYEKLFDLTLTAEEYAAYQELSRDFSIRELAGFLNNRIMLLGSYYERALFLKEGYEEAVQKSEAFYELTLERDERFVEKMLTQMSAAGQTRSALVAGGYHAANLKNLLKQQGVSYVSITPQILQETNLKKYESVLLGQQLPKTIAPNATKLLMPLALSLTPHIQAYESYLTRGAAPTTGARLARHQPKRDEYEAIRAAYDMRKKVAEAERNLFTLPTADVIVITAWDKKMVSLYEHYVQEQIAIGNIRNDIPVVVLPNDGTNLGNGGMLANSIDHIAQNFDTWRADPRYRNSVGRLKDLTKANIVILQAGGPGQRFTAARGEGIFTKPATMLPVQEGPAGSKSSMTSVMTFALEGGYLLSRELRRSNRSGLIIIAADTALIFDVSQSDFLTDGFNLITSPESLESINSRLGIVVTDKNAKVETFLEKPTRDGMLSYESIRAQVEASGEQARILPANTANAVITIDDESDAKSFYKALSRLSDLMRQRRGMSLPIYEIDTSTDLIIPKTVSLDEYLDRRSAQGHPDKKDYYTRIYHLVRDNFPAPRAKNNDPKSTLYVDFGNAKIWHEILTTKNPLRAILNFSMRILRPDVDRIASTAAVDQSAGIYHSSILDFAQVRRKAVIFNSYIDADSVIEEGSVVIGMDGKVHNQPHTLLLESPILQMSQKTSAIIYTRLADIMTRPVMTQEFWDYLIQWKTPDGRSFLEAMNIRVDENTTLASLPIWPVTGRDHAFDMSYVQWMFDPSTTSNFTASAQYMQTTRLSYDQISQMVDYGTIDKMAQGARLADEADPAEPDVAAPVQIRQRPKADQAYGRSVRDAIQRLGIQLEEDWRYFNSGRAFATRAEQEQFFAQHANDTLTRFIADHRDELYWLQENRAYAEAAGLTYPVDSKDFHNNEVYTSDNLRMDIRILKPVKSFPLLPQKRVFSIAVPLGYGLFDRLFTQKDKVKGKLTSVHGFEAIPLYEETGKILKRVNLNARPVPVLEIYFGGTPEATQAVTAVPNEFKLPKRSQVVDWQHDTRQRQGEIHYEPGTEIGIWHETKMPRGAGFITTDEGDIYYGKVDRVDERKGKLYIQFFEKNKVTPFGDVQEVLISEQNVGRWVWTGHLSGARLANWVDDNTPALNGKHIVEVTMEMALSGNLLGLLKAKLDADPSLTEEQRNHEMRKAAMSTSVGGIGPLLKERVIAQSELGADITGVSLLYDQVWVQHINKNGDLELKKESLAHHLKDVLEYAFDEPVQMYDGRTVVVKVWKAPAGTYGKGSVYFLDPQTDSEITFAKVNVVYPGHRDIDDDARARFDHSWILGRGALAITKRLNKAPDVIVMSEASAMMVHHRVFKDKYTDDPFFDAASYVFNDHTPLLYAHPQWDSNTLRRLNVDPRYYDEETIPVWDSMTHKVDATALMINAADGVFGVAKKHAQVMKDMELLRQFSEKITSVTNGVSPSYWPQDEFRDPERVRTMTDADLLAAKDTRRQVLIRFLAKRLSERKDGIDWNAWAEKVLREGNPIGVWVRRIVEYKRLGRFADILENDRLRQEFLSSGNIFIVGGRIHQDDNYGLTQFYRIQRAIKNDPTGLLKERVIFFDNYNIWEAPILFSGADFSVMLADDGREASATGFQKAQMSGAIIIASNDGAVPESTHFYNGANSAVANGILVEFHNHEPTADGLSSALALFGRIYRDDKTLLGRMVRNALNQARRVSVERTSRKMLEYLEAIQKTAEADTEIMQKGADRADKVIAMMSLKQERARQILERLGQKTETFVWRYKNNGFQERTLRQSGVGLKGFLDSFRYIMSLGTIGRWSLAYHAPGSAGQGDIAVYIESLIKETAELQPVIAEIRAIAQDLPATAESNILIARDLEIFGFIQELEKRLEAIASGARLAKPADRALDMNRVGEQLKYFEPSLNRTFAAYILKKTDELTTQLNIEQKKKNRFAAIVKDLLEMGADEVEFAADDIVDQLAEFHMFTDARLTELALGPDAKIRATSAIGDAQLALTGFANVLYNMMDMDDADGAEYVVGRFDADKAVSALAQQPFSVNAQEARDFVELFLQNLRSVVTADPTQRSGARLANVTMADAMKIFKAQLEFEKGYHPKVMWSQEDGLRLTLEGIVVGNNPTDLSDKNSPKKISIVSNENGWVIVHTASGRNTQGLGWDIYRGIKWDKSKGIVAVGLSDNNWLAVQQNVFSDPIGGLSILDRSVSAQFHDWRILVYLNADVAAAVSERLRSEPLTNGDGLNQLQVMPLLAPTSDLRPQASEVLVAERPRVTALDKLLDLHRRGASQFLDKLDTHNREAYVALMDGDSKLDRQMRSIYLSRAIRIVPILEPYVLRSELREAARDREKVLALSIDYLSIEPRGRNALRNYHILTIGQLVGLRKSQILMFKSISNATAADIEYALRHDFPGLELTLYEGDLRDVERLNIFNSDQIRLIAAGFTTVDKARALFRDLDDKQLRERLYGDTQYATSQQLDANDRSITSIRQALFSDSNSPADNGARLSSLRSVTVTAALLLSFFSGVSNAHASQLTSAQNVPLVLGVPGTKADVFALHAPGRGEVVVSEGGYTVNLNTSSREKKISALLERILATRTAQNVFVKVQASLLQGDDALARFVVEALFEAARTKESIIRYGFIGLPSELEALQLRLSKLDEVMGGKLFGANGIFDLSGRDPETYQVVNLLAPGALKSAQVSQRYAFLEVTDASRRLSFNLRLARATGQIDIATDEPLDMEYIRATELATGNRKIDRAQLRQIIQGQILDPTLQKLYAWLPDARAINISEAVSAVSSRLAAILQAA